MLGRRVRVVQRADGRLAGPRPDPPDDVKARLHARLATVVAEHFEAEHWVDDNLRTIPGHYHAHARPRGGPFGGGMRRVAGIR